MNQQNLSYFRCVSSKTSYVSSLTCVSARLSLFSCLSYIAVKLTDHMMLDVGLVVGMERIVNVSVRFRSVPLIWGDQLVFCLWPRLLWVFHRTFDISLESSISLLSTVAIHVYACTVYHIRSQWPRDLRRRSAAERFPGSWVPIPGGGGGIDVCLVQGLYVVRWGLCDGPIPRPEESYRMWCVLECDQVKNQNPLHLLWTNR
jgi:hypothetical protein